MPAQQAPLLLRRRRPRPPPPRRERSAAPPDRIEGSAALGATAAGGSTAPGQPEGRAWGQQLVVINEVTAIDLASHTATLRGGDGWSRTIAVKDPEMQDRMRNLRVGDLVELTYSEAVAAKVLPKS
jgi:hypothetical protein